MNKLLVILGPTSTGKTDLGLILAKKYNGEIISADSRQVYKYLDIGTGKFPTQSEKSKTQIEKQDMFWVINGIKVWMYDVVDPEKRFNLYGYIIKAEKIIGKILEKGKLPILTGGTGLYIRSLLGGISDLGIVENSALRRALENLEINEITKKIEQLNPEFLKILNNSELHNKRRLIRIYEKLISPTKEDTQFPGIEKDFDVLKIGLTIERNVLRERIKRRILSRIDQGMIAESQNLLARGILIYERMEELGLEYKYIAKFLKGEIKTQNELVEILSLKISQFAKRQMTWFKKEKYVYWFDTGEKAFLKKVEDVILNWYTTCK